MPLPPTDRIAPNSTAEAQTAASIAFEGVDYILEEGQSVLDALLAANVDVPYSCRKGTCFSCVLKHEEGDLPVQAQSGLRTNQAEQGYFLSCQCRPAGPLKAALPDAASFFTRARVTGQRLAAPNVLILRLCPEKPFQYRAGQYLTLRRPDGLSRSYSLASVPGPDSDLEIHVKRMPGGVMSNWLHDQLEASASLDIQGPYGDCYYPETDLDQPSLLIGTGTGLAPLMGIVREALLKGHRGEIRLYHGSGSPAGLYHNEALRSLDARHPNLTYCACVSRPDPQSEHPGSESYRNQRADRAALGDIKDLEGWRIYLCGNRVMVQNTKKLAFLAGADLTDIHVDPFELRDLRKVAKLGQTLPLRGRPDG